MDYFVCENFEKFIGKQIDNEHKLKLISFISFDQCIQVTIDQEFIDTFEKYFPMDLVIIL